MTSSFLPSGSNPSRGEASVTPAYFTSSLFVESFRDDLNNLISTFEDEFSRTTDDENKVNPFALFKNIWTRQGWHWLHMKVLEIRGRDCFVHVVYRLFLGELTIPKRVSYGAPNVSEEKAAPSEPAIARVVSLFALYTFHYSQPSSSCPPIHSVDTIPIPDGEPFSLLYFP